MQFRVKWPSQDTRHSDLSNCCLGLVLVETLQPSGVKQTNKHLHLDFQYMLTGFL